MIRFILFLLFSLSFTLSNAQLNMELISQVDFVAEGKGNGNDIWGYVAPDGTEYAIVGTTLGTLVYSLEDPANPIERTFIPGSSSTWRDMKQWGDYAYVTTDSGNDGLLIINMEGAPENIESVFRHPKIAENNQGDSLNIDRCHNIYIDDTGIIYLAGCHGTGVNFFDPNIDPWDPPLIGAIVSPYHHDVYVKDNILHGSRIFDGDLALYDVSDKTNPTLLGSEVTSSDFTHNAWGDPDNNYSFTTDERPEGFVDAYDISDPANIQFLDKFMPPGKAGTATIPHNTHYLNGYLVTSWYTSGVIVIDGNKPDNLVQVAEYDTYDGPDGGFSGCWGVTPFLPSGIVIANDINSGFYVFDVNYSRACYLEGTATDINSGEQISGVSVEIINGDYDDEIQTEAMGIYKTGQPTPGTYSVVYSHPLYESQTHSVDLTKGEVTIKDVQLGSKPSYTINFEVKDEETGQPIPDAKVELSTEGIGYNFKTDENGSVSESIIEGSYTVSTGIWGYENKQVVSTQIEADETISFDLLPAYMDDFIVDQGWIVENIEETNSFSGAWERAFPAGTFANNGTEIAPDMDSPIDIGNQCYVTENAIGATPFSNDVDDGETRLTSPVMKLSTYENPIVQFSLWFQTAGGNSAPDDEIEVFINNGTSSVSLLTYSQDESFWTDLFSIELNNLIDINDNMTLTVVVGDSDANGHIVEAGFDDFFVMNGPVNNTIVEANNFDIYPSPASDIINISYGDKSIASVEIINQLGQVIIQKNVFGKSTSINTNTLTDGNYFVKIYLEDNKPLIQTVQIIH